MPIKGEEAAINREGWEILKENPGEEQEIKKNWIR